MRIDNSNFTNANGKVLIPLEDWNSYRYGNKDKFRYSVVARGVVRDYGETGDWKHILKAMESTIVTGYAFIHV